ncbi:MULTISPECIES: hypothetical protein [unclassified Microcoleus]|uniref:hypothetical protein n=1 Tax=unclassified Microcoleus TaxID=2642155 RepID=UPI002FD16CAB
MKIFSAIEHPQVKINLNSKKETADAANSFGDATNQKVDRRLFISQDLRTNRVIIRKNIV